MEIIPTPLIKNREEIKSVSKKLASGNLEVTERDINQYPKAS
jgi:hypothetical protein